MADTGGPSDGILIAFYLAMYVVSALALMTIANKTGTDNSWMAWIPFLNVWLMIEIAGLDWWYLILFFVPLVNLAVFAYAWWCIAGERGFPEFVGLLTLIPCLGMIVMLYIAFAEPPGARA